MNIEMIRELFHYHYWAYQKVWECVAQLPDEQFEQPVDYSVGSIHNQLVHCMSADWIWLSRLNGIYPESMMHGEDYPTRDLIEVRWQEIEGEFRAYLARLSEADLRGFMRYRNTAGEVMDIPVWGALVHVVNHATNHRAQILAALHQMGAPTVEMDLLFYLREKAGLNTT